MPRQLPGKLSRRPARRSRRRPRQAVLPLALAAALAAAGLAACSDDGGGGPAADGCVAPGVTSDQVVAGLLYPDSGPIAGEFLAFRGGVDARLGAAAEEGGVHGRQVVYRWADDTADPATNLTAAQRLVERDQVFGIMELSTASAGSAEWLHQQGIPVTGHATDPVWGRYDNMFSYSYLLGDESSITTYGVFARNRGGTRAALIYVSLNAFGAKFADAMTASLEAAGIRVVERIDVMPGISDPRAAAARIIASGADVVTGSSTEENFAAIVNLAVQGGADLRVVLSGQGYGSTRTDLQWPDGAYAFLSYQPFESVSPAVARFLSAMSRYAPQIQPAASNVAMHGWIAADMFLRGLHEAGPCPTREAFLRGLAGVTDYDAGGLLVHPRDFSRGSGTADLCYSFVQFDAQAGSWHPVPGAERLCGQRIPPPAS